MQQGRASETAYRAARARAWHQVVDVPRVFDDPLAVRFLRAEDASQLKGSRPARGGPLARGMRMALAVRSRIAEDALHEAMQRGVRQYVVLGAGFDTFALRNPHPAARLRVFEVDHPDTQATKRQRIEEAGLPVPPSFTMVPVDFAADDLKEQLESAGFAAGEPAFFAFLGVAVYLEAAALEHTLRFIAACAKGTEVVFDYVVQPSRLPWLDRLALHLAARRCARLGEPWKCFLDPDTLPSHLAAMGFTSTFNLGAQEIVSRLRATVDPSQQVAQPRFGMGRIALAQV
jgi:methyltransferase (TIGR00027 family)